MLPVDFAPSVPARRDVVGAAVRRRGRAPQLPRSRSSTSRRPTTSSSTSTPCTTCRSPAPGCSSKVTATLHSPPTPWLESALSVARQRRNPPALASVSGTPTRRRGRSCLHRPGHRQRCRPRHVGGGRGRAGTPCGRGRMVPEKAPHLAIDACRRAGHAAVADGSGPRPPVLRPGDRPATRLATSQYLGHGTAAEVAARRRALRRRRRHADVGRAVRARRRRGAGLRHAGGRLPARRAGRPRRRRHGRGGPGRRRRGARRRRCSGRPRWTDRPAGRVPRPGSRSTS